MRARAAASNAEIELAVRAILEDVRENGWEAVRRYSEKFDGREPYELEPEDLERACAACDPALIAAMEHAAAIGLDKKGAGAEISVILLEALGKAVPHKMPKAALLEELT